MAHTLRLCLKLSQGMLTHFSPTKRLFSPRCSLMKQNYPPCTSKSNEQSKTRMQSPLNSLWRCTAVSADSPANPFTLKRLILAPRPKSTSSCDSFIRISQQSPPFTAQSCLRRVKCFCFHLSPSNLNLATQSQPPVSRFHLILCE